MQPFRFLRTAVLCAASSAALLPIGAIAATDTASFDVTITLTKTCDVSSVAPTDLNFGSTGLLNANVDQSSTITVTCSQDAAYNIGLDAGLSPATPGDTTTRRMSDGNSHYVQYQLYQDALRGTDWGDAIGSDTQASTGIGSAQAFTVYGRVPPQSTPPAGSYADTITVTVTY
ncbi:MAG TPA: spore coat U domain-containing protein [Solimonas sp.]